MAAYAGRHGRAQHNGTNLQVEEWVAEVSSAVIDVTTFEDQAAAAGRTPQTVITGNDKVSGTIKGYVDSAAMPSAAGFTRGATLTNLFLYLHKTDGGGLRRIALASAVVSKIRYMAVQKGRIDYQLDFESTSTFVEPV